MAFSARLLNAGPSVLGEHDWINDNFEAVLVGQDHVHSDTHTTYSDISGNFVANIPLAGKTISNSTVNNYFDCNDIDFGSLYSGKFIYIVRRAGGALAGTDLLVSKIDLNAGESGNITVDAALTVAANGLMNISVV